MTNFLKDNAWLFIKNDGHEYDPVYRYLVVNVSNEPVAKFTNQYSALEYVLQVLDFYGRVIDTKE